MKCKEEPESIKELRKDAEQVEIFQKFNLLQFFDKFRGYNEQLVLDFIEGFRGNSMTLGSHTIPIIENSISKLMGLPIFGENLLKRDSYPNLLEQFHPNIEQKAEVYKTFGHIQGVK